MTYHYKVLTLPCGVEVFYSLTSPEAGAWFGAPLDAGGRMLAHDTEKVVSKLYYSNFSIKYSAKKGFKTPN